MAHQKEISVSLVGTVMENQMNQKIKLHGKNHESTRVTSTYTVNI